MVKTKSLSQGQSNYKSSASTAAARYKDAANSIEWRSAAEAGQALYEEAMQTLEILRRRLKGIQQVDDAEFRSAVISKGVPIIRARMEAADGKWASGFSPYREVLESLSLPAKSADPMANIDNRLKAVVQALVDKKNQIG